MLKVFIKFLKKQVPEMSFVRWIYESSQSLKDFMLAYQFWYLFYGHLPVSC